MLELAMPSVVDVSPFQSFHSPHYQRDHHNAAGEEPRFSPPEVLQAGHPLLGKPVLSEVTGEDIGSCQLDRIINNMVAAMRSSGACGLAAPQIGHALQIIVVDDPSQLSHMVIINPKLKVVNPDESETASEECPSISGYSALVRRYTEVEVSGLNRRGEPIQVHAKGRLARTLQHECDHLEGVLYVDKMVPRTFRSI